MDTNSSTSFLSDKKRLSEISIIRFIITLSLVINHAFVKIAGGGLRCNDYQLPDLYRWINYFNFEATMELFVLISGYLFAFQTITLQRHYTLKDYVLKKAHRLLLPMIVFGIVYYFCFYFNSESFSLTDFILKLLSGCGHLWFLSMLFWCLLILWMLVRFRINEKVILICLAIVSVVKRLPLPLGFALVPHYLFYAYFGYFFYKRKNYILDTFSRNKWIIPVLWLLYIVFVCLEHSSGITSITADSLSRKGLLMVGKGFLELLACICVIYALLGTTLYFTKSKSFQSSPLVKMTDKVSFGIYIYHQFLLVALYHYTPIVSHINVWLLPWVGFVFALSLSFLLSSITLRTKWGRFLIG